MAVTITTNTTYYNPAWAPPQQTAQIGAGANQAVTFNATETFINCELGSMFSLTLTANVAALSAINPQPGQKIDIFLKQDGTGSRTVTWNSWLWAGGTAPTLSTTASATDRVSGIWNDSLAKWVGSSSLNIS